MSLVGFLTYLVTKDYWQWLLAPTLAVLLGLLRYGSLTPVQRALMLLVSFDLLAELSNFVFAYTLGTNLFLVPYTIVGELILLLLLYGRALQSGMYWRIVPWVLAALATFAVLSGLRQASGAVFQPALQVLANLVTLALPLLYFHKLMHELRVRQLSRDPIFWVSVVLVLVALGDLFISLFSNYMLRHFSLVTNKQIWRFHTLLVAGQYLVYGLALWRGSRPLLVAARS